jgi:RNA polymerase sigma-70 factor (ECF subfamily)
MNSVANTVTTFVWRRRSDADVFRSALRGDPVAFSEVYRRYHERVYAFCVSRLMSPDAAHDAANETFLRLLTAQPDSIRSPESWLFGVARHICIDVARRDSKFADAPVDDCEVSHVESSDRAAEDHALSREEAQDVLLALRRVRPRYRAALILREVHHEPVGVIAETLGVNSGAASTILSRARDAFGRAYAEVLGLQNGCREAVGMIYRRTGSGLSAAEEVSLEAHIAACPACRREAERSAETLGSPAVLLFISQLDAPSRGLIARSMEILAREPSIVHAVSVGGSSLEAPVSRAAAGLVTVLVALTVGVNAVAPAGLTKTPDPSADSGRSASVSRDAGGESVTVASAHQDGTAVHSGHDQLLLGLSSTGAHRLRDATGAEEAQHLSPTSTTHQGAGAGDVAGVEGLHATDGGGGTAGDSGAGGAGSGGTGGATADGTGSTTGGGSGDTSGGGEREAGTGPGGTCQ